MQTKLSRLVFFLCLWGTSVAAQVTGGVNTMEFLRLPNSPHITALGGYNVAMPDNDISFALQNPALMRPELHNQLGLNYNAYYAGISIANLAYGYYVPKLKTSFVLGVQYLNYGSFQQTDNLGSIDGTVRANEYAITLGASRAYGPHWRYGVNLKYAGSHLADKSGSAVLGDVGIAYYDTASLWNLGVSAKNMGVMAKKYTPGESEPVPFDLQIGVSKRFKHLPLRLFATVHHLYEWDVRYDNPADVDNSNVFGATDTVKSSKHLIDKLARHLVVGGELSIGKRITVSGSYNHLRRAELGLTDKQASSGFAFGLGIDLTKLQVHYGRSYYSLAGAYNEFGLNILLNKFINVSAQKDEKMKWSPTYGSWDDE